MEIEKLLNGVFASKIADINTCFIGKIVKINDNNTVNIQPVIKREIGEKILSIPVIEDVEFLQNHSTNGFSALEYSVDNYVLCLTLQRDHTNFFKTHKEDKATTKRILDLADTVALPFFYSNKHKIEDEIKGYMIKSNKEINLNFNDTSDIKINDQEIKINFNNTSNITLKEGKVKIEANGIDIIDLLSQTLQALAATTVPTVAGASPLSTAPDFTQLKTQIDSIKIQ